jgi:hypothetical protein
MENLDQDTLISLVVFGILDFIGVCVLLAGLITLLRAKLRSGRQHRADATVVQHQRYSTHMTSSGTGSRMPTTMIKPVLRFTVRRREHTVVSRIGSNMPPAIGSAVRVAYDPYDPDRAEIDTVLARYLVPVVLLAVGILLVAIFTGVGWSVTH